MNGATADPCVSTIRPPNRSRTTMIGRSQNFFRSRMNAQNSRTNSLISKSLLRSSGSLELSGHMGRGPERLDDPIRLGPRLKAPLHQIMPAQSHDDTHRRHEPVEDHGQDDPRIDPRENLPDLHPDPVWVRQAARKHQRGTNERHGQSERPGSSRLGAKDGRPDTDHREDAADDQAEVAKLFL